MSSGYPVRLAGEDLWLLPEKALYWPAQQALLIADVQLPDGCGIELCRQLCKPHIGKILISSNASEQSRVQGLGAGADDYICKPVFPQELLLRIQGLLRRLPPHAVTVPDLRFLQFRLNLENRGSITPLTFLAIGHDGPVRGHRQPGR